MVLVLIFLCTLLCHALTEGQDKESTIASETIKMKKEDPRIPGREDKVAEEAFSGALLNLLVNFPLSTNNVSLPSSKVWFLSSGYWLLISENCFSCPSPFLLLWPPTQSLLLLSTTLTTDFLLTFIGPESDHWQCLSITHSLTHWLLFSTLDWSYSGPWRCQLKTCWGCYCCGCWCWGSCWQQLVDLGADVWS